MTRRAGSSSTASGSTDELPAEHWYYLEYVEPHYRADRLGLALRDLWSWSLAIDEIRSATWGWNAEAVKITIRSHAGRCEIIDAGAEWRVAVDGALLEPGVAAPLAPGALIDCPGQDFRIRFHGTEQPELAARYGWLPKHVTGYVEVTAGQDESLVGRVFAIRRHPFRIGVSKSCDLVPALVAPTAVSRLHAMLMWEAGIWRVEDCRAGGTTLNGSILRERAVLAPGDVIEVGHVREPDFPVPPTRLVFHGEAPPARPGC